MQKVLWIVGVCALGTLVLGKSTKSNPMVDDLLLKNVEALADSEDSWGHLPIDSIKLGDYICPKDDQRVKYILEGLSLGEDEETY